MFFAIMVLVPIAVLRNVGPEMVKRLITVIFGTSAGAWGLSRILPDGWLDLKRTTLLAMVLASGVCYWVLH